MLLPWRASLYDIAFIEFVPPSNRGDLAPTDEARARGWLELEGGERISVTSVQLEDRRLLVRSAKLGEPTRVELEDVHSIVFPRPAGGASLGGFRFHFGPGAGVVARFEGIERDGEDGPVRVLRSEPGFLGTAATTVTGTFKMTRDGLADARVPRASFPTDVVLESGEAFPAAIEAFDRETLTVTTPFTSDPVWIPRSHLRAIVFAPRRRPARAARADRTKVHCEHHGAKCIRARCKNAFCADRSSSVAGTGMALGSLQSRDPERL